MAGSYLLKEDGGKLLLEDGSGALLLEEAAPSIFPPGDVGTLTEPETGNILHALIGNIPHSARGRVSTTQEEEVDMIKVVYSTVDVSQQAVLASDGVAIYTPTVGDLLWDAWVQIPTAWDGTTPQADIGNFLGGNTFGWYNISQPVDLSIGSGPVQANDELDSSYDVLDTGRGYDLIYFTSGGATPGRFTGTAPIKVVVSQDGTLGGAAVGGSAGELSIFLLVATPVAA